MRPVVTLVISLMIGLVMMGCSGGGGNSDASGTRVGAPETSAEIVDEAIQLAIDRTIIDCTGDSASLVCLDASTQGPPLLADNDTIERISCGWSCLPVPTNDGGERYVRVLMIWERFVDRCYGESDPLIILAFEQPILCTPDF